MLRIKHYPNKSSHGGIDGRNDAGYDIPSNVQIHRNEMSDQTRKDILILGAKGQMTPMDLAHDLCRPTLIL